MGGGEAKPEITHNNVIKIFEEGLFTGQKYRRMEDQKLAPGLACNLCFAEEKELNLKFKRFPKLSEFGDVASKLVYRKRITDGGLGAAAG